MKYVLVTVLLIACDRGDSAKPGVATKPSDPSLALAGEALENFCRNEGTQQEIKNGVSTWKCDRFANCTLRGEGCPEPRSGSDMMVGCDPYAVCVAKVPR